MSAHEPIPDGRLEVITSCFVKPIPVRSFDWEATFDDYDLGDVIGFGRTEEEALADLMERIEEAA